MDFSSFLNSINSGQIFIEVVQRFNFNGISQFDSSNSVSDNLVVGNVISIPSISCGRGSLVSFGSMSSSVLGNSLFGSNSISSRSIDGVRSSGKRSPSSISGGGYLFILSGFSLRFGGQLLSIHVFRNNIAFNLFSMLVGSFGKSKMVFRVISMVFGKC